MLGSDKRVALVLLTGPWVSSRDSSLRLQPVHNVPLRAGQTSTTVVRGNAQLLTNFFVAPSLQTSLIDVAFGR